MVDLNQFSQADKIYNFSNQSTQVFNLPVKPSNRYFPRYRSFILNIEGKIHVFISTDRNSGGRQRGLGMFTEHYILIDDEFVLKKVYENIVIAGYLHSERKLFGYVFEDIDDEKYESKLDPLKWYKYHNSDIGFFTFNENIIRLDKVLKLPKDQLITNVFKMKEQYLMLGHSLTQLSWLFNKDAVKYKFDYGNTVSPQKLVVQKELSLDPFLMLFDKSFEYVDSIVYPDRIESYFGSIEKIDDEHYMLFKKTKGSKASVTINKL